MTQVVDSCQLILSLFYISLFPVGWLVDGDRLFGLERFVPACLFVSGKELAWLLAWCCDILIYD